MHEIWYPDYVMTNEIILNSFKYADISSELDGSQDNEFRGFENLEKENETILLENEESLDQKDDYEISRGSGQYINYLFNNIFL